MRNVRSLLPLLALVMVGSAVPLFAQGSQSTAPAPYIETFDVRLHDLDVIVTDRAGKSVTGLRKEDFEVTENGAPQTVTNFTFYGESSGATTSAPNGVVTAAENDEGSARRFVFFIDELALHPYTRNKLIVHATNMIRSSMKPGDQAMIITPAADQKVALPFTSDVDVVVARLREVFKATGSERADTQLHREQQFLERQLAATPRSDKLYGDHSVEHQRRQIKRMYARAAMRRVEQRFGQLRSIVAALAEVPGRKVLILTTESLSATPGLEAFRADSDRADLPEVDDVQNDGLVDTRIGATAEYGKGDLSNNSDNNGPNWGDKRQAIRDIARKASSNGITIYCIQPEFGFPLAAPGGVETRAANRTGVLNTTFVSTEMSGTETTMAMLSDLTGGKWYRGDGPVDDAFRQVSNDVSTYYSLGYPAPEGMSDVARAISVSVKGRPELRVRFRKELVEKSLAQEMSDQVVANLLVPRSRNELNIDVTTDVAPLNGNTREVTVQVDVPLDKLVFLPEGNDTYKAQFSVHYAAAGRAADFMSGENRTQYIAISGKDYANIGSKYWKYVTKLRVPMGSMSIAVGVMDTFSRLTGFQTVQLGAAQTAARK